MYSPRQFFDTRKDSTFSRYSPGFYYFSVHTLIRPFLVIAGIIFRYSHRFYLFPVLARILPFFGTHTNSTLFRYSLGQIFDTRTDSTFFGYLTRPDSSFFRYSHRFDPFSVLVGTIFLYLHGFYLFLVFSPILPFLSTHTDSTLFRYSPWTFFDTSTDSTFWRYSPGFYHFSVLTLIRPFSGTRRDNFMTLARMLPFRSEASCRERV